MVSLLPPNSTVLERDLETVTARLGGVPVEIDTLWRPQEAPERFLPFLAWALSVDVWRSDFSESVRRSLIDASASTHRIKGTRESVQRAVEAFGAGVAIREWFELEPQGQPYTFQIDVAPNLGAGVNPAELTDDIRLAVELVKPVRSQFSINVAINAVGQANISGVARVAKFQRLTLED